MWLSQGFGGGGGGGGDKMLEFERNKDRKHQDIFAG